MRDIFFDDYPQFCATSEVAAHRGRLNLRYEAIVAANRDILQGARVLDIAAHDGRWSFAALRAGASHVTGVEARQDAVDSARHNFSQYDVNPDAYRFVCGDIFDVLSREKFDVDVVFCLGYLYHTYRHTELLRHIRDTDPTYVIIDTDVVPHLEQPFVKLVVERRPDKPGNATPEAYSHGGNTIVGRPTVPALRTMLEAYDFGLEDTYDWDGLLAAHPGTTRVGDYAIGKRVTLRCRSGLAATAGAAAGASDLGADPFPGRRRPGRGGWSVSRLRDTSWRELVNRSLAKATGYELRRSTRSAARR